MEGSGGVFCPLTTSAIGMPHIQRIFRDTALLSVFSRMSVNRSGVDVRPNALKIKNEIISSQVLHKRMKRFLTFGIIGSQALRQCYHRNNEKT